MPPSSKPSSSSTNASVSKKYVKLDPREHVLTRPGMYIGSLETDEVSTWTYEGGRMRFKPVGYTSGLYKIYDEIIVNVLDHVVRVRADPELTKTVKEIRVSIDPESGRIEVFNTGEGVEVVKHKEYNVYIPELVFGNMLTSTNYDDTEERVIGGQNGIGAKACNIFSTQFTVETVDSRRKKRYVQAFSANMSVKTEPEISAYTKYPFTRVRFVPDYARFKHKGLAVDMRDLMTKRVHDICALTPADVKVFLNDEKIECKNFEKYVDLYLEDKETHPRVHVVSADGRWEVSISSSREGFRQVSFVNGINTFKGGKHVDYVVNQITKKLCELITKRRKITVRPNVVKDNLFVFIKSTINNPTFDSQTKEFLTTPVSKFGTKFELDDKTVEKVYKFDIVDRVVSLSEKDDAKEAKKTDGRKRSVIRGIQKLDDANWAGTAKSKECTLILTEGDSAKSMAISGLSEIGRNKYGVFPLKGKIMNVKDTNSKRINDNEEITNLKKILGLEHNKVYDSVDTLRYGHIMVLTDADTDGSHIKGLLFNLFHTMWPSLMKMNATFMTSMMTPIVKVTKGKASESFYNLTTYDRWKEVHEQGKGWEIKYYKGLGTSTNKEAKEYFKNMRTLEYEWSDDLSEQSINLAFNKKLTNERKDWLYGYDKDDILDDVLERSNKIEYSQFIHKELIHFSNYNVERSIPSICDGFKRSLRKIMYCCLKRKLHKEIKVAQLAGYVSEHGAYHHGEASLYDAIIGMAQDFVGSNNINLLLPNGQFGTRIQGGKDSASPRYIHTQLNPIVTQLFPSDDFDTLDHMDDDGMKIEPVHYVPIIPMILVNGSVGIGTGFSTNIPCYNPKDIVTNMRRLMRGELVKPMTPWYRGFNGTIACGVSRGVYKKTTTTKLEVMELPVGFWTEDFKLHLENYIDKHPKVLKDYESHYTEKDVRFILTFQSADILTQYLTPTEEGTPEAAANKFEAEFKMLTTRPLSTSNMHLYTEDGKIKKYESAEQILCEFYHVRLKYFQKRKDHKIQKLEGELKFLDARIRFIDDIVSERLGVMNVKRDVIIEYLREHDFPTNDDSYDYLIKMPIHNLTYEKKKELEKESSDKHNTLQDIRGRSLHQMWTEDLDALEKKL